MENWVGRGDVRKRKLLRSYSKKRKLLVGVEFLNIKKKIRKLMIQHMCFSRHISQSATRTPIASETNVVHRMQEIMLGLILEGGIRLCCGQQQIQEPRIERVVSRGLVVGSE